MLGTGFLSLCCLTLTPTPRPPVLQDGAVTTLEFLESPVIDLYFHVRSVVASGAGGGHRIEALDPAIQSARALDQALGGSPLAWGPVEGLLFGCKSAAEVQVAFARLPKVLERGEAKVELRAQALELAGHLAKAEGAFVEPSKRRAQRVAAARARFEEAVAPKWKQSLSFHLASLGITDPALRIPVYLLAEVPPPGAITHRNDKGAGVCFVGVDALVGSQLFEAVLHEATHALDLAAGPSSVLGDLRQRLDALGLPADDRAKRDLPHLLMFVQSAETIRRHVDPSHRDYGEVSKAYERLLQAQAVRTAWRDHLDGKLTRDEVLDALVASVAPAPK